MNYLPIFIDIKGKRCLVVGGGEVALRKCRLLVRCGAQIRLVATEISAEIQSLLSNPEHQLCHRAYTEADMHDARLVIAATNSAELNTQLHEDAVARHIPVNVVDQPTLCTFIFPSVIDRDPIIVAVSSGAKSPLLARQLRARLETLIPAHLGKLADFAAQFRQRIQQTISDPLARRHFWESVLQGPVAELVMNNREADARHYLEQLLGNKVHNAVGEVYLVGAGPGDPDLLTFKALRLMQQADVVLYDRLVSEPILDLVRKDAQLVYAGKQKAGHTVPQAGINDLLVHYARQGMKVLRLKGGDPFIFGRGGEEIEELAEQGIPFQVVPGITAASGCAAYAGIPLTHRDYAHSVRFLTGHQRDDRLDINWQELTDEKQTLVFYMGLTGIRMICEQLIQQSHRRPDTPVALIEKGTTHDQRVLVSTLEYLPGMIARENVVAPTLTIVGDVVRLREKLQWKTR
jgi:uroporphyrin-III C-methyltransferase/precorrin-2 dehydrogenase/sirohydrochlorin ferrochelatase